MPTAHSIGKIFGVRSQMTYASRSYRPHMSMRNEGIQVIRVDRQNVDEFLRLIQAFADFEHLEGPNEAARLRLVRDLASDPPMVEAYLAILDGNAIGFATVYFTYSTFLAKPTLFLEDIFVLERHRKKGIGSQLFSFCAQLAKERGCGRMEWTALDWNVGAHSFYERMGGKKIPWVTFRLTEDDFGEAIRRSQ